MDGYPTTDVVLTDHTRETAMIAVQGPLAVAIVTGLCLADDAARITALRNYHGTLATIANRPAAVSRTGYTGEDGVELVVTAADALAVWEAVLSAGSPLGLRACGLGARDTLRLEAGMPLYGHELLADSNPFAIGLGFAVNLNSIDCSPREFPGATALRRLQTQPAGNVRVGLLFAAKRAAREGAPVTRPGDATAEVGRITSGSYCPTLGAAAAMALVDRDAAQPGTVLDVMIRDAACPARIEPLPFYRRPPAQT